MTHKCYRRDPNVKAVTDLVTDEQMQNVFQGTNFGHDDFRGLLAQGCIKALAAWHQGHTLTTILEELRLISWNRQTSKIKVTAKGRPIFGSPLRAARASEPDRSKSVLHPRQS